MKAKTRINLAIYTGIAIIVLTIAGAFYEKYSKERKKSDLQAAPGFTQEDRKIDRGIIDSLWIEPPHEKSRKNIETGQWEYAQVEESYWMRLVDPNSGKFRILSIAKVSYDMYLTNYENGVQQFTQIFDDTASYNANQRKAARAAQEGAEQARLVITPEPTINPRERDSLR